jgi:hypothetical protein
LGYEISLLIGQPLLEERKVAPRSCGQSIKISLLEEDR